jgi:hypothetical protein
MGSTPVLLTLRGTVVRVDAQREDGENRVGVTLTYSTPHERRIAQTLFAS